jgi:phage shock protein C
MSKKLYRSEREKMLGGVCGGLAEYLDIDVNIMRLLFIAAGLLTVLFPMVIFYIIAWIIVPVEEEIPQKSKPNQTSKPGKPGKTG